MSAPEATTRGVRVRVEPQFSQEHSGPGRWFFLYNVQISNEGSERVQLISRHWIIEDGTGHVEEVRGAGVVGDQPVLDPGQSYEYTSGCPLPTPFGTMRGTYQMVSEGGEQFEAEIPEFVMREAGAIH